MPPPILLRRAISVLNRRSLPGVVHGIDEAPGKLAGYLLPALDIVGVAAVMYRLLMAQ